MAITEYRKEVSYFFQNALLFDETVRDNLEFPYKIRNEEFNQDRAIEWLEKVSLSQSYLDKSIEDLSGGERQRVAFIRNLQYVPEVLLLDEVTSSLDTKNTEILGKIVSDLIEKEDITVLAISHNESESLDYTKEIFIKDGRVEER